GSNGFANELAGTPVLGEGPAEVERNDRSHVIDVLLQQRPVQSQLGAEFFYVGVGRLGSDHQLRRGSNHTEEEEDDGDHHEDGQKGFPEAPEHDQTSSHLITSLACSGILRSTLYLCVISR